MMGHVAESHLYNERPDTAPTVPQQTTYHETSITAVADKALGAISLAVSNPEQGYVQFAELQGEWAELEEQVAKARGYLDTLETLIGL